MVLILKKISLMDKLMEKLAAGGIKGATVLDGVGMGESLAEMEGNPMFGMLRRILADEEQDISKVVLTVLRDEQVADAKAIIKEVLGDISKPNTGIIITLPVISVEGMEE